MIETLISKSLPYVIIGIGILIMARRRVTDPDDNALSAKHVAKRLSESLEEKGFKRDRSFERASRIACFAYVRNQAESLCISGERNQLTVIFKHFDGRETNILKRIGQDETGGIDGETLTAIRRWITLNL